MHLCYKHEGKKKYTFISYLCTWLSICHVALSVQPPPPFTFPASIAGFHLNRNRWAVFEGQTWHWSIRLSYFDLSNKTNTLSANTKYQELGCGFKLGQFRKRSHTFRRGRIQSRLPPTSLILKKAMPVSRESEPAWCWGPIRSRSSCSATSCRPPCQTTPTGHLLPTCWLPSAYCLVTACLLSDYLLVSSCYYLFTVWLTPGFIMLLSSYHLLTVWLRTGFIVLLSGYHLVNIWLAPGSYTGDRLVTVWRLLVAIVVNILVNVW